MFIVVVFELHLFPINKESFKLHLIFPVISSVSRAAWKLGSLMFLHVGSLPHKTSTAQRAVMDVDELCEVRIPNCTDDVFNKVHR